MSFDPKLFGQAMGEAIRKAVEPLKAEIADLRKQLTELPAPVDGKDGADGRDGKDCDMDQVKAWINDAVSAIPAPKDGKDGKDGADGADGQDGKSFTLDDAQPIIEKAISLIRDEAQAAYQKALDDLPVPKDGKDGADGRDGVDGAKGEPGKDGADIADLMIDRAGELVATLTDGRMKNLGPVVGKDGKDGKDGQDGIGLDDFEIKYDGDSHEIVIRAIVRDRKKEIRYPAGGIVPGGYWRNGNEARAGQAWTHDGSLWIATKDTKTTPSTQSDDWVLAARKGRDGERGARGKDATPPSPIKLNGGDDAGDV